MGACCWQFLEVELAAGPWNHIQTTSFPSAAPSVLAAGKQEGENSLHRIYATGSFPLDQDNLPVTVCADSAQCLREAAGYLRLCL